MERWWWHGYRRERLYTGDGRAEKVSVSRERESRMYTGATRANQERVDEREVEMQGDDLECAP